MYAFICVFTSYLFQILPDGLFEDCKKNLLPEQEVHHKTNSLTRRYKNRSAESSSPIMGYKSSKIIRSNK